MSKYCDMIGWEDAPHLQPPHITKEELDDLERDMLPHQKAARRQGRPSLGAGAIYPVEEDKLKAFASIVTFAVAQPSVSQELQLQDTQLRMV